MKRLLMVLVIASMLISLAMAGAQKVEGAEEVTITFATWGTPQLEGPSITAQLEAFAKEYPHIKVEWDMVPFWDFEPKVKTRFAGGNPYDVFWIATEFGPRSFLKKGAILNLQPYLDKELAKDPNFFYTKYLEGAKENVSEGGDVYFLPFLGDNSIIYFNKDLFDEAGLPYPPQTWEGVSESDWNWDVFVQTAQKLTKKKGDQVDVWGYIDFASIINVETLVHQLGGNPEVIPPQAKGVDSDTPNAIAALQFLYDLRYKYEVAPTPEAVATQGGWERFLAGKLGMATFWSAHTLAFIDAPFKWDLAHLPANKQKGGSTWHSYMAIAKPSKHPDEAWELLKFLCGPPGQTIAAGKGFEAPLMDVPEVYEAYRKAEPLVSRDTVIESSKYSHLRWPIEGAMEVFRMVNQDELQKMLLKQQSVEQTAKNIKERAAGILEKY